MLMLEFLLLFLSTNTHVFGPDWLQQLFTLKLFLLYSLMYFRWRTLASLSSVFFMSTLLFQPLLDLGWAEMNFC